MTLIRPASGPLLCLLLALGAATGVARAAAPFRAEDLVMLKRISDPQVSPDARYLAFVERETDMEANRGRTAVWLLDLGHEGAAPQRLTELKDNAASPR